MNKDFSVKLQGEEAHRIIEMKEADEKFNEELCNELKMTMDRLKEKAKVYGDKQAEEIKSILKNTALENADPEDVTFDTKYYGHHETIYAREEKTPTLGEILQAMLSKNAGLAKEHGLGGIFEDFEIVEDPNVASAWNEPQKKTEEV